MTTADVSLAQQTAERAADILRQIWATAQTSRIQSAADLEPGAQPTGIDLAAEAGGDSWADPAHELAVHVLEAVVLNPKNPVTALVQGMMGEEPPGETLVEWQYVTGPRFPDDLKTLINAALTVLSSTGWWWTWLVEITTELDYDTGVDEIAAYLADHPARQFEAVA